MQTRARDLRTRKAESVVTWAHDRLDLTFEAIGETVGASKRTILRWRSGEAAPRRENEERLARLDELRFWLQEVFGDEREAAHRASPSEAVRGRTGAGRLRPHRIAT